MPSCPSCQAAMDADEVACAQCGHRVKEQVGYRVDYTQQELIEQGLSSKFVEFVFLEPKPAGFRKLCDSRHNGWPCFVPKDVSGVYPLWTCNGDVIGLWRRRGQQEFVRLRPQAPAPRVLARSEQGLLADLFRRLLEAQDWQGPARNLGRLRQLADVAGFHHLDALTAWHERNGGVDDFYERWERFLAALVEAPD